MSSSDVTDTLFSNKKTRVAARIFLSWLKERNGQASKNAVSNFADMLASGKFSVNGSAFRYSRRNFYLTVLRSLVSAGFVGRNVPAWDGRLKRTQHVYMRNIFDIPRKAPSVGFWRLAYFICRKWNNSFRN